MHARHVFVICHIRWQRVLSDTLPYAKGAVGQFWVVQNEGFLRLKAELTEKEETRCIVARGYGSKTSDAWHANHHVAHVANIEVWRWVVDARLI
jgi:hypothetical protein